MLPQSDKLVLYSYWRSSAAWRARIVLALKGIDYEYRAVNLATGEQRGEDYKGKVHPGALVPALITNKGNVITQSLAIVDYLESLHPSPMLSPVDPLERANMLELVYTIACDIHPLQNLRVLQSYPETDRPTRANQVITEGLATFEALLRGGKYCVGDTVTLADVVLVPQVYNAIRWGVEMKNFPKINKIVDHLRTLPPFLAAHPDSQPDSPNHQK